MPDLWSDAVITWPATPFSAAETSGEKPSSGSRLGKPCFCDIHVIPANSPCLGHIPLGLAETMLEKYWCNRVWPGHQCWDGSLTGQSSKEWFCQWWRCVSTSRSSNQWLDACHAASEGGFRIADEKINKRRPTMIILDIAPGKYQTMILPPESKITAGSVNKMSCSGGNFCRRLASCFSLRPDSNLSRDSLYRTMSILSRTQSNAGQPIGSDEVRAHGEDLLGFWYALAMTFASCSKAIHVSTSNPPSGKFLTGRQWIADM